MHAGFPITTALANYKNQFEMAESGSISSKILAFIRIELPMLFAITTSPCLPRILAMIVQNLPTPSSVEGHVILQVEFPYSLIHHSISLTSTFHYHHFTCRDFFHPIIPRNFHTQSQLRMHSQRNGNPILGFALLKVSTVYARW